MKSTIEGSQDFDTFVRDMTRTVMAVKGADSFAQQSREEKIANYWLLGEIQAIQSTMNRLQVVRELLTTNTLNQNQINLLGTRLTQLAIILDPATPQPEPLPAPISLLDRFDHLMSTFVSNIQTKTTPQVAA